MTTTAEKGAATRRGDNAHEEPIMLKKRIGSTTFVVAVHFSQTDKKSIEDKVFGLIESEVRRSA